MLDERPDGTYVFMLAGCFAFAATIYLLIAFKAFALPGLPAQEQRLLPIAAIILAVSTSLIAFWLALAAYVVRALSFLPQRQQLAQQER